MIAGMLTFKASPEHIYIIFLKILAAVLEGV